MPSKGRRGKRVHERRGLAARADSPALLDAWLVDLRRRPLVLRGARQVGKTWLVRELSARSGRELAEINFERDPTFARAFASNDPREIAGELSLRLSQQITPSRSLLFLDEIQAAGAVLAKLRWFYEELPELPVIAAGSLLESCLADYSFSMPVGRVSFLHVEPMGFAEYLRAHDQQRLSRRWPLGARRARCLWPPMIVPRSGFIAMPWWGACRPS